MKALTWIKPNQMVIENNEIPKINPNEVLIKVEGVGICGSEIEGYLGHNALRVPPLVMGHEFCGIIEEIGDSVDWVDQGQKVVVNPLISCENCNRCRRGYTNLCDHRQIIGIHRKGALAEYVAVPASCIIIVPNELNSFRASLAEPLACSLRAVRRAIKDHPFGNILVYGAGTIGVLSALVAKLMGVNKVIMLDINNKRLNTVKNIGIEHVINPSNCKDFEARLKQSISENDGVDVIIDAAGFQSTRTQALTLVNPGGVIMNIGLGTDETSLRMNHVVRNEISIQGSFCYTKQDFYDAVKLLEKGKVTEEGWSEIREIEEGDAAFKELAEGRAVKSKIFLNLNS